VAGEQATPPAAAPEPASSPLSSPSPSPAASTPAAAPAAASPSTPSSPDGTTSPPTRPDGIPDSYWDATANALKVDPAALAKDLKERDELKTFKAAEDVRKGSLPQKADDYKVELPSDFKPPAGVEFKLDATDPAFGQLKAVAHKHGLTQAAVNELIGVYAGKEVGSESAIATARAAEVAKLGTTGPSRVDAVTRWMDASGLGVLKSTLVTAAQVEAFEKHINALGTQGAAGFSQSHRVAPDTKEIPGYENMSFEQRRFAQDQRAAQRRTG
jgi:hypothetical protein